MAVLGGCVVKAQHETKEAPHAGTITSAGAESDDRFVPNGKQLQEQVQGTQGGAFLGHVGRCVRSLGLGPVLCVSCVRHHYLTWQG
jgi:hypothetical protein